MFIALGGSSYAAVAINGSDIKRRSISGSKIKRSTITNVEVRESRLGRVPRASIADELSPAAAASYRIHCPAGMFAAAGTCVELQPRDGAPYGGAVNACADIGSNVAGPRRRLPTHGELVAALARSDVTLSKGPELTSDVYPSSTRAGGLDVLVVMDQVGAVGLTANDSTGGKAFRCAVDPTN